MSIYRMTKAEREEFDALRNRLSPTRYISLDNNSIDQRDAVVADLMAFLGIIHNTPAAKRDWIEGR